MIRSKRYCIKRILKKTKNRHVILFTLLMSAKPFLKKSINTSIKIDSRIASRFSVRKKRRVISPFIDIKDSLW